MGRSPAPSEVRELRETYGLSQTAAAELVYSALRSWQNWEAGEVSMHPAIWAWFRHVVVTAGSAPPSPLIRLLSSSRKVPIYR